ncbi:MAG: cell division ATP-binding protein FtsE [Clostridia bacterium]|nr:cell division ATP-binding protein FtsE [Clostridia bacterium]
MVFFSDVSKKYEKTNTLALDRVSFYIEKGEFVFIIGSSGAGKSTLTKLMLAEEQLTDGNITINGTDVGALKAKNIPFYRRSIGMVFQDFRLLNNKSVYDNVAFAMKIRNASKKEIRRAVPAILSMVGISDKAKAMPYQLSGGEQQRVALARAMVNNPAVLIADEPTGNLDPATADEIMELFEAINKRGTTVIIITHAKDIVDKMQKRVIELEHGSMIRDVQKGGYKNEEEQ